MSMTVFEIPHSDKDRFNHLSFIVICNKLTSSNTKTKEHHYGLARTVFKFKHKADENEVEVILTLSTNKKDATEDLYVNCDETNYSKRHIIAASYRIGEARYVASFNDELIFCINVTICSEKDAAISEETTFNFVLSASDKNTVGMHKLCVFNKEEAVNDLAIEGVTLKDLQGKINQVKTKSEIKITEKDISGGIAVLEYIGEKHAPELASAILKWTPGFVVYNFVGMKNSKRKEKNEAPSKTVERQSAKDDFKFVVVHQNVQSVNDKTPQLNIFNSIHKPDVLALSEVFNRQTEMESVNLTGYVLANSYCRTSVAHGGVAIYIREGLNYTKRNDLQEIAQQVHFEVTAIEVNLPKLVAIALYRTGNGKFTTYLEKLELLLDKLTGEGKRFLIVGDHNVHEITEDNFKRRQRRKVEYVLNSYGCINTVKFKTRGDASLDCGIANHARNELAVKPVDENISDHNAQVYQFTTDKWRYERNAFDSIECRLFNDGAIYLLYHDIKVNIIKVNLSSKSLDVNKEFNKLFKVLPCYIDLHFPIEKKTTVPWLDEEVKDYLLECNGVLEVKRQYPDDLVVSHSIKDLTFEARQKLVKKRLDQYFPARAPQQEIWKTDRSENSEIFQEDPSKYSVRSHVPPLANDTSDKSEFNLPYVTRELLDQTLQTILETTPDTCDISLSITFCLWPAITNCLAILVNAMFKNGLYPDVLKTMTSGVKSEDDENKYRPIFIQPIVSKTVESIIASHMVSHLDTNLLLANRHYADGPRVSATMTVHTIFDHVLTGLDEKRKMAGIFCDLSKAFNVVSHKLLLNKLYKFGIKNNALSLVQSFLQGSGNGDQRETDNSNRNCGVPQGSVLGDALFLLYVNDLPKAIDVGRCVLAPDATAAIIMVDGDSYENLRAEINKGFQQLSGWLLKNDLPTVNFEVMNFSSIVINKPPLEDLPLCDKHEFIGFVLDSNFSWKSHVDTLCDKLSSAVFALRKLKPLVSRKALKRMYYKYFHLPMSYGILVWGNSVDTENVLNLQKRALRTLEGVVANYDDTKELFRKKRIFTHYSQYLFELLMFARINCTDRGSHRLKFAENNPRISGPDLYAKLPATLKNTSVDAFKSQLKNLLLDNPLYSLNEFNKLVKKMKDTSVLA